MWYALDKSRFSFNNEHITGISDISSTIRVLNNIVTDWFPLWFRDAVICNINTLICLIPFRPVLVEQIRGLFRFPHENSTLSMCYFSYIYMYLQYLLLECRTLIFRSDEYSSKFHKKSSNNYGKSRILDDERYTC